MCYGLAEWRVPILDELDGRDGAPCRVLTMMSGGGDDLREEVRFVVAPTSEGRQPRTTGVIDAHPFTTPCGSDIPSSLILEKVVRPTRGRIYNVRYRYPHSSGFALEWGLRQIGPLPRSFLRRYLGRVGRRDGAPCRVLTMISGGEMTAHKGRSVTVRPF